MTLTVTQERCIPHNSPGCGKGAVRAEREPPMLKRLCQHGQPAQEAPATDKEPTCLQRNCVCRMCLINMTDPKGSSKAMCDPTTAALVPCLPVGELPG